MDFITAKKVEKLLPQVEAHLLELQKYPNSKLAIMLHTATSDMLALWVEAEIHHKPIELNRHREMNETMLQVLACNVDVPLVEKNLGLYFQYLDYISLMPSSLEKFAVILAYHNKCKQTKVTANTLQMLVEEYFNKIQNKKSFYANKIEEIATKVNELQAKADACKDKNEQKKLQDEILHEQKGIAYCVHNIEEITEDINSYVNPFTSENIGIDKIKNVCMQNIEKYKEETSFPKFTR